MRIDTDVDAQTDLSPCPESDRSERHRAREQARRWEIETGKLNNKAHTWPTAIRLPGPQTDHPVQGNEESLVENERRAPGGQR